MSTPTLPPPLLPIKPQVNHKKSNLGLVIFLSIAGSLILCFVSLMIIGTRLSKGDTSTSALAKYQSLVTKEEVDEILGKYTSLRGSEQESYADSLRGTEVHWVGLIERVDKDNLSIDFGSEYFYSVTLYITPTTRYQKNDMIEFTAKIAYIHSFLGQKQMYLKDPIIHSVLTPFVRSSNEPTLMYETYTQTLTPTSTNTFIPTISPTSTLTYTPSNTFTVTSTSTSTSTSTNTPTSTSTSTPTRTNTPTFTPTATPTRTITPIPPISLEDVYANLENMTALQFKEYKNTIIGKKVSEEVRIGNVDDRGRLVLSGSWNSFTLFNIYDFCVVVNGVPTSEALMIEGGSRRFLNAQISALFGDYGYFFNCENTLVLSYINFGN